MRLTKHSLLIPLCEVISIFLLLSLLVTLQSSTAVNCESPSTVFVLETSDSDSLVSNNGDSSSNQSMKSSDDLTNTRIITDNNSHSSSSSNSNEQSAQRKQNTNTSNQRSSSSSSSQLSNVTAQQQQSAKLEHGGASTNNKAHDQVQNDEAARHRDTTSPTSSSRRLEEDSQLTPTAYKQQSQQKQQNQSSYSRQKQASSSSTTTTSTTSSYDQDQNTPKTEERLLISISSEDDDSYSSSNKPPKVSSSGYNDDSISGHNQQVHQHQKRKPAITISIQDANINKQNGGSGGSAVILRPGEDGQSIVIATVGTGGSNFKPTIINTNQQPSGSHHITNNNNNNNDPYREPIRNPINNPMQDIIQQHQRPISTTRRPLGIPINSNDPYRDPNNSNNNNRPVTSTLIDGHRPPQQVTDERPHRPVNTNLDDIGGSSSLSQYETTRRPLRPVNPPPELSGHNSNNNNQQDNYDNNRPIDNSGGGDLNPIQGPKYPLNEKNCGIMHETRIVGGEEADPDDFMWMAAIIKSKPREGEQRPFCGGSLITRRHILTAAHCLEGLAPRDVLVRLGSYDFEDSASSTSADYAIDQFRVPAQYSKKTHVADIAIMRLKTPLSQSDNYKTVCMPLPRRSYVGALGTVTGYGSQSQQFRRAAPKLRQVTVPIWENRKCSTVYKKALNESFLCAGYEEGGKDACQGDSGGPLMTEGPEQKMMIVGVVSHGIGCGSPGYPGVYTRTSTFQEWIEKNTSE